MKAIRSVHDCKLVENHRDRVTGWTVVCSDCGPLRPGHYSKARAVEHLNVHQQQTQIESD